ncbi:MAG: acyl-CoA dehydrogenase family protein [Acidobacteriota bacterium]|nr:acyl-CoA dehydrogenase family protein [Acidobacteriota bacterium]MDH3524795.1 acyl-CoA dehydrogenase family protein [Acidobacteriota bacterium]
MDFDWSDEQLELRRAAVEFASRRLVEGVIERDRECVFSRELWDACAEFGLQGILVPAEWQGAGHDLLTAVAVLEGIGYGARDNGLVFSVAAHAASCEGPLVAFGSAEQRQEWLPRLADGSAIGATGITEPDSGSNALALATTAVESGGGWILDGSKTFVTNAPVADLFLIYARTGGSGFAGITCFLVPRGADGLTVGEPIEKMGVRTSPMAEVFLSDCRVPASAVVGGVGSGAMIFNQTMDLERLLVMAPAIGVMERLLERCTEHARQRTAGSIAIARHQSIAHRIADMELELEAARLLLYRAAWHRMHRGTATRESALAKLAVSEAYVAGCRSAVQIFGGYGYTVEYELERELRDALAATLYVGTSEIQRNLIAGLRGLG